MRLFVMVLTLILAFGAGVIAADMGACPTSTCPSPSPKNAMRTQTIDTCLMCTFGMTQQQICDLRSQGYSDRDIAMIGAFAKKACVSIDDVVSKYCECKDWNAVAYSYKLCLADIQTMANQCVCAPACPASGAGPCDCYVIYGLTNNVILTLDEAKRLYKLGYDWMDVALATNIATQTGYPIILTLMDIRRGVTYEQVARMHGVPYTTAFNFTNYLFPRTSVYSAALEAKNMDRYAKYQIPAACPQVGCGPRQMIILPRMNPQY
ncbi:MAG: hypothetical protein ABFD49_06150 [Armatimonadota bacterium]